jgi:hypothetical protein
VHMVPGNLDVLATGSTIVTNCSEVDSRLEGPTCSIALDQGCLVERPTVLDAETSRTVVDMTPGNVNLLTVSDPAGTPVARAVACPKRGLLRLGGCEVVPVCGSVAAAQVKANVLKRHAPPWIVKL